MGELRTIFSLFRCDFLKIFSIVRVQWKQLVSDLLPVFHSKPSLLRRSAGIADGLDNDSNNKR